MAVKTYALTTGQRAADFMGLGTVTGTKLTLIERLVDSVTDFIEKYIGYRVKSTVYTNETYDTEKNSAVILLNHFPVSVFTSLQRRNSGLNEDEWETVDSTYYHVDTDSGIIEFVRGYNVQPTTRGYRATYTAGYVYDNAATFLSDTAAADLEMAAWLLISTVYDRRSSGVESESIGDYSVKFAKGMFENDDIKGILDKYAKSEAVGVITPINT